MNKLDSLDLFVAVVSSSAVAIFLSALFISWLGWYLYISLVLFLIISTITYRFSKMNCILDNLYEKPMPTHPELIDSLYDRYGRRWRR